MSISREFVRLMGGDLTVSSQAEKGSVFKFDVRVQAEEKERGQAESAAQALSLAGMPNGWLADMRQATIEGDLGRMMTLIEQARDRDAALANMLTSLADNFDHDGILNLIRQATRETGGI